MTGPDTKLCAGCGKPTTGMCWTDCGMSLCGAPLCGDCHHVDEKYGWRHEPKYKAPLVYGTDLSPQEITDRTRRDPAVLAALPEVQALIRQEREACAKLVGECATKLSGRLGFWVKTLSTRQIKHWIDVMAALNSIAAAIRKRGEGKA